MSDTTTPPVADYAEVLEALSNRVVKEHADLAAYKQLTEDEKVEAIIRFATKLEYLADSATSWTTIRNAVATTAN